jgi:uncharacterized protein (TIGR02646 family)
MRPVIRGEVPTNPDGTNKVYSDYANARQDLISRMGEFCSYCNMRLSASLAVEHVQPKDHRPALKLEWSNFLLACTNCNSTKSKKIVDETNIDSFFWADKHNTHIPFIYNSDGSVNINTILLSIEEQLKAQNMLDLVGLQKYTDEQEARDRRWKNRKEAYEQATEHLNDLEEATINGARIPLINVLATAAYNKGFFSIWFTVFQAHDDVKQALIEKFTGTATECFDVANHYASIKRTAEM